MGEPKVYINLLRDLVAPVKSSHQGNQDGSNLFRTVLTDNLSHFATQIQKQDPKILEILKWVFSCIFKEEIKNQRWEILRGAPNNESAKDTDYKWVYVTWNLVLLHQLVSSIESSMKVYQGNLQEAEGSGSGKSGAPPMSPDTLSFSERKTVTLSIQFAVCLGILPYLQPGVGIPFERRSEFAHLQKELEVSPELTQEEQEWRLMVCCRCLTEWTEASSIASLILSRHLGDLLAALLQLVCSSSLKKRLPKTEQQIQKNTDPEVQHMTPTCRKLTSEDVGKCEELLQGLLNKVHPPALVQELLILQAGAPPAPGKGAVRSPAWLRGVCSRLLSDILVKPKGVQYVLRGMLAPHTDSSGGLQQVDWKKCDAVSRIIAHCPKRSSIEDYYKLIAPQVIKLLQDDGKEMNKLFLRVAVGTITVMVTQHPEVTRKYVLMPLSGPLYTCIDDQGESARNEVIVNEEALTSCLNNAHKLFVVGMEPQGELLDSLHQILHVLFRLYTSLHTGVSHLKSCVEELLVCYLKQASSARCGQVLKLFVFEESCKVQSVPVMRRHLSFSPASQGGVQVLHTTSGSEDWENRISCVVELMVKTKNDDVVAGIFIDLLKELTSVIAGELAETHSVRVPVQSSLLDTESVEARLLSHVMMLSLLASMCDKLGDTCFKSTAQILEFVQVTLERCVMVLKNSDDEMTSLFGSETVAMAMGLLTAVMGGASEVSVADREKTKELLPLLQTLSDQHEDETVREMATDLRIAIATHGFVLSEALKDAVQRDKTSKAAPEKDAPQMFKSSAINKSDSDFISGITVENDPKTKKPLIEVLSSTDFEESHDRVRDVSESPSNLRNAENVAEKTSETEEVASRSEREYRENYKPGQAAPQSTSGLEQAFEELLDPLVPVRGHALISLRRLLEQKDPQTLDKQATLVKIFHENLDHSDTYIYLAAIQGLAVLTSRLPDQVLPLLAEEYVNFDKLKSHDNQSGEKVKQRSPELRMKLGEVLMKCIRDLGDTAPKYRDLVLRSLLSGTRDTDALVRASALSNLAEICRLLKFALGGVIYEILECVSSLVKCEQDIGVKRAAVVVLSSILQGLGHNTLKVLGSALRDMYHLLKHVERHETDSALRVHTDRGLEVLDSFMREYLFPKQTLTKKICVLDPPNKS